MKAKLKLTSLMELLTLAAVQVLIVSCGPSGGHVTRNAPVWQKVNRTWKIDDVTLKCANKKECPEAVGALFSIHPIKSGLRVARCTATLITPNEILTSGHCNFLKQGFSTYFLTNGSFQKKQVIRVNGQAYQTFKPGDFDHPDAAVLTLEHPITNIQPLDIDRAARPIGHEMKAYVVNQSTPSDIQSFEVDDIDCRFGKMGMVFPFTLQDRTQIIAGQGCEAVQGNSGAPFINASTGTIDAVLSAVVLPGIDPQVQNNHPQTYISPFIYATNVACLSIPGWPAQAAQCLEVNENVRREYFLKSLRQNLTEFWGSWLDENNTSAALFFQPSDVNHSGQSRVIPMPACYFPKTFSPNIRITSVVDQVALKRSQWNDLSFESHSIGKFVWNFSSSKNGEISARTQRSSKDVSSSGFVLKNIPPCEDSISELKERTLTLLLSDFDRQTADLLHPKKDQNNSGEASPPWRI